MDTARTLCRGLATIEHPRFSGLICLDLVDGKVIEVNPRLTASAPIAHILGRESQIAGHLGGGFRVERIDLNSRVRIAHRLIANGLLSSLVEDIWKEHGALILPQGLNPFLDTRVVFLNDRGDGAAQRAFVQRIGA